MMRQIPQMEWDKPKKTNKAKEKKLKDFLKEVKKKDMKPRKGE